MKGDLLAIDLATGKPKWRYKAQGAIEAAPGIRDGKLFFGDQSWASSTPSAPRPARSSGPSRLPARSSVPRTSAAIMSSSALTTTSSTASPQDTGKVVWKFETDAELHASPCIADGAVIIGGCDAQLRVIDAAAWDPARHPGTQLQRRIVPRLRRQAHLRLDLRQPHVLRRSFGRPRAGRRRMLCEKSGTSRSPRTCISALRPPSPATA